MSNAGAADSAINDQIQDAIDQLNASIKGVTPAVAEAMTCQAMSHAVGMMLQNTVLQQQHDHMLRNALTTAAASALLNGKREEAEAVLALADTRLGRQQSLSEEIAKLGQVLRDIAAKFNEPPKASGEATT